MDKTLKLRQLESTWQKYWSAYPISPVTGDKYYCLSMFPYPSGTLHLGHVRVYTIADAAARWQSLLGRRVHCPMGWDSFGLPAENAAIQRNLDPAKWTESNIVQMKQQMNSLGFMFDWSNELATHRPDYYKWTQHIFQLMHQRGIAYQDSGYINWDPIDQTVLANEQVDEQGISWRSGAKVERKQMKQWYVKITDYAEDLHKDLEKLNWPDSVKNMQRGWIGRQRGYNLHFQLSNGQPLEIFTTDASILPSATFISISPEKAQEWVTNLTQSELATILGFCKRNEVERKAGTGSIKLTSVTARHPSDGRNIPIIVAENLISGCRLGVPGFNEGDAEVANANNIEILYDKAPYQGPKITTYRLRDWLVSRQRYWGAPIPMHHWDSCGAVPIPLPVLLESPTECLCPKCSRPGRREQDTLDTFFDSAWYFLRYSNAQDENIIFDKKADWMPVDLYIGGIEHAILHLLYARFMQKFLYDCGLTDEREPFLELLTQGLVLGRTYKIGGRYLTEEEAKSEQNVEVTYEKMSKSKGNGVAPESLIETYGADVTRLSMLFAAPSQSEIKWKENLLKTMQRWLVQISDLIDGEDMLVSTGEDHVKKWSRGVKKSMDSHKFHVVIARCMELTDQAQKTRSIESVRAILITLYCFAPHFSAEYYKKLVGEDIRKAKWI